MSGTRKCDSCGREKDLSEFPDDNKRTCSSCKIRRHQQIVSGSPEAYLKSLHTKAKSAVNAGKRADHVEWLLTPEVLIDLWKSQGGRCAVSGMVLTHHKDGCGHKDFNASIDRINNDRSYTPDNVRLVCYRVNILRHSLTEDMFYFWIRTIHDFSCKHNISWGIIHYARHWSDCN